MNPALAAIAAITIAGAVLAVSARDVRATLLGLLVVLLGAPLVTAPWPDPLSVLARIAATLLAVRLVSISLRGDLTTNGTRIGWPAEALLAGSAAVVGFGSHGLGAAPLGPAEAQATGFALVVLAVAPLFAGRDAMRLSVGALLLLVGATAIRTALDAPASQAEQLVGALLTIALGGAIAVIVVAARAAGGLAAVDAATIGPAAVRPPDAHRPAERAPRTATSRRAPAPAVARAGAGSAAPRSGSAASRSGSAAPGSAPTEPPAPGARGPRRPPPEPVRPTAPEPARVRPAPVAQPGLWGQLPVEPDAPDPPTERLPEATATTPTAEPSPGAAVEPRPTRPARAARSTRRKPGPTPEDRP